ncbi:MAG: hypothetical protein ABJA80_05525 [bacterium]
MTVGEWLDSRTPRPPAALVARLATVLNDAMAQSASGIPELFLSAGETLVARLLRNDSTARDSALDLLAADALLTYAFEAAGADVTTIDARATLAMSRIAALAAAPAAIS